MIKVRIDEKSREGKLLILLRVLNVTEDWKLKPFDCKLLAKLILSVTDILKRMLIKGLTKDEVTRAYEDAHMLAFSPEYKQKIADELHASGNVIANSLTFMRKAGILNGIMINELLLVNIDKIEVFIDFKDDKSN